MKNALKKHGINSIQNICDILKFTMMTIAKTIRVHNLIHKLKRTETKMRSINWNVIRV